MPSKIFIEPHGDHQDVVVEQDSAMSKWSRMLGIVADVSLLLLIFLFPLFYIPDMRDALELPKQLLLIGLGTFTGIFWIIRVFVSRTVVLRPTFLFLPMFLFFVGVGIATLTSIDRYTSLFGGLGGEYASFVSLIGFLLLVFFIVNNDRGGRFLRRAMTAFFLSACLVIIEALSALFGISLPPFPDIAAWNSIGSAFSLGVFAAATAVFASGVLLFETNGEEGNGRMVRVLLPAGAWFAGIASLVYLFVLDWWIGWVLLIVGAGLLLLYIFVYAHLFRSFGRILLPVLAMVLAVLFLFLRTPVQLRIPAEISPGRAASWQVARETLRERPVFGSGPATYTLDYMKHVPLLFMQTPFWNVRFGSGSNYAVTLLPTVGLVAFLFWVLFVVLVAAFAVKSLFRDERHSSRLLTLSVFAPWLTLVVAQCLYGTNMSLQFLFWLLTALLFFSTSRKTVSATFSSSPRALLGTSFGAVLFVVFMIILVLLATGRAMAWDDFADAIRANAAGDIVKTRNELTEASKTDPRTDIFMRNLAQARLFEASRATSADELRATLNTAVGAAQRAVVIGPKNPANWYMLGIVFRELTPAVAGAGERAIQAFEEARIFEPRNPVYPMEMSRIRIALADAARLQTQSKDEVVRRTAEAQASEQLAQAYQLLQEAIELKSDYAPAHFYTALVLERQGKLAEAVSKMETVRKGSPRDVGVAFQLGVLYIKQKDLAKAEAELKRALDIAPNYANARWYLASIYEARGDLDAAIKQIEAILAGNPENQLVKNRLEGLKKGKSAKELPPPVNNEGAELSP